MIKNADAYRRRSDAEDRETLACLSVEESIAIGEALLTSDLMRLAEFPDDDQPRSLTIALGIERRAGGGHGGE